MGAQILNNEAVMQSYSIHDRKQELTEAGLNSTLSPTA